MATCSIVGLATGIFVGSADAPAALGSAVATGSGASDPQATVANRMSRLIAMMVRILNPNLLPTLIAESVTCYVVTALLCLPVARVAQVPLRVKQETSIVLVPPSFDTAQRVVYPQSRTTLDHHHATGGEDECH